MISIRLFLRLRLGRKSQSDSIKSYTRLTDNRLVAAFLFDPYITGYTSLIGKRLPDLSGFQLEPKIENIDDKRLLICFFHFDQRPSRYCVRQLKMKAVELHKHNVLVIFVHASRVPKKVLNDFRIKERITLPIGIIGGDHVKIRQEWAVESLPWLILTDRKHIVTAECFALTELNEKIK